MPDLRLLTAGDQAQLETFLARYADSSMFLRSNARAAGLVDASAPLHATYVAAYERGGGAITAVAAHCWNGMVLLQAPAPTDLAAVVREAVRRSGRRVTGFTGPWAQVVAARTALGLRDARAAKDTREDLYALDLRELVIPALLTSGATHCRHPNEADLDLLAQWRVSFSVEALAAVDTPALRRACRADVDLLHTRGADWVLYDGPTPVAYSAFNAMLPDIVQVGGVWTPPSLRGRGYGRAVVAGSLLAARKQGVERAVLFADPANRAAKRAYGSLGFRIRGDYGLVLLGTD